MKLVKYIKRISVISAVALFAVACAPAVGSKEWCDDLEELPKSEWTENEALNYVKFCLTVSKDES